MTPVLILAAARDRTPLLFTDAEHRPTVIYVIYAQPHRAGIVRQVVGYAKDGSPEPRPLSVEEVRLRSGENPFPALMLAGPVWTMAAPPEVCKGPFAIAERLVLASRWGDTVEFSYSGGSTPGRRRAGEVRGLKGTAVQMLCEGRLKNYSLNNITALTYAERRAA